MHFCRIGTKRMLEILERITMGEGTMADLENLSELSEQIKAASLCGLGQSAPNPVVTTLRYFRDEYVAHIEQKKCPAHVCAALLTFTINDKCPDVWSAREPVRRLPSPARSANSTSSIRTSVRNAENVSRYAGFDAVTKD